MLCQFENLLVFLKHLFLELAFLCLLRLLELGNLLERLFVLSLELSDYLVRVVGYLRVGKDISESLWRSFAGERLTHESALAAGRGSPRVDGAFLGHSPQRGIML